MFIDQVKILQVLKQKIASIFMSYVSKKRNISFEGPRKGVENIFVDDVVEEFVVVQNSKAYVKIYNISTGVKAFV